MPLSLKTKFTVATSLVVLGVVTCVSWLFLTRLSRQVIRQADDRAHYVAQEVLSAVRLPHPPGPRTSASTFAERWITAAPSISSRNPRWDIPRSFMKSR